MLGLGLARVPRLLLFLRGLVPPPPTLWVNNFFRAQRLFHQELFLAYLWRRHHLVHLVAHLDLCLLVYVYPSYPPPPMTPPTPPTTMRTS